MKNSINFAGIYIRTSSSHQNDIQSQDCIEYCKRQGWQYEIYEDKGCSGTTKDNRDALHRLLEDSKNGKVSVMVVYRGDRLSRSVRDYINLLYQLEQYSCGYVSVNENICLTKNDPLTKVVMVLISSLAEMEVSILKERQKAGIEQAKERGVHFGRPRVGFDIKKAIELREEGLSLRKVAKQLSVSVSTLSRNLPKVA